MNSMVFGLNLGGYSGILDFSAKASPVFTGFVFAVSYIISVNPELSRGIGGCK